MIHDLYIALCAHHPRSNQLPLLYIWLLLFFTILSPLFPLVTAVCVYEFQFYILHISKIIWFLAFSDWLILLGIIFSWFTHVVRNVSISSYGWVVFHCLYVPRPLYPVICQRTLPLFHVFITVNNAEMNIRVHISLQINVSEFCT